MDEEVEQMGTDAYWYAHMRLLAISLWLADIYGPDRVANMLDGLGKLLVGWRKRSQL